MKIFSRKSPIPSLKVIDSDNELQKISFQDFDEEPTLIFLNNNRDSLKNTNWRPNVKTQQSNKKHQTKLITCQSNLIQSSPQRSEQSRVDGQFVCKYLTPIKKQQFDQLLFMDEINENIQNQKTKQLKANPGHKNIKNHNKTHENKSIIERKECVNCQCSNMVKSFQPCGFINSTNQKTCPQNKSVDQSKCYCNNSSKKFTLNPSIFVDPNSQIFFLKQNNKELFKKLQNQTEKNKILQQEMKNLLNQNKNLSQKNVQLQEIINHLNKKIIRFEQQKKKILVKEWEEFQFVKQLLIEKKRSKSKQSLVKNAYHFKQLDKKGINLSKTQIKQSEKVQQIEMAVESAGENFSIQNEKPQSFCRDFSSGKVSPSIPINTIYSQDDVKNGFMKKKRKLSFENYSESKKLLSKQKQRNQIDRILQNKLLVFQSQQNRCKKSDRSSPRRKTYKRNVSSKKQNLEPGPRQNNRTQQK